MNDRQEPSSCSGFLLHGNHKPSQFSLLIRSCRTASHLTIQTLAWAGCDKVQLSKGMLETLPTHCDWMWGVAEGEPAVKVSKYATATNQLKTQHMRSPGSSQSLLLCFCLGHCLEFLSLLLSATVVVSLLLLLLRLPRQIPSWYACSCFWELFVATTFLNTWLGTWHWASHCSYNTIKFGQKHPGSDPNCCTQFMQN